MRTTHKQLEEDMEEHFDYSRYLACSTDIIVEDLTEFSVWTWLFVLVVTAIKSIISHSLIDSKDNEIGLQMMKSSSS